MAFTRKFLKALGLEDDKIDTIMEEHTSVTDALKKERDGYKTEADKLPEVQKQLDEKQKNDDGKDYKQLYTDLVKANEAEKERAGKSGAYKDLLKSAGVAEKFWPLILKANTADIDKIEFDGDKVKDAEAMVETMKTNLSAYIPTTHVENPGVDTPPDHREASVTKEQFDRMSYRQRKELYDKNPDAYHELTK